MREFLIIGDRLPYRRALLWRALDISTTVIIYYILSGYGVTLKKYLRYKQSQYNI